jgi:periplasmic protein TonB
MNTPAPPQSEWVDVEPSPKQVAPTPPVPRTPAVAAQGAAGIAVPALAPVHVQVPSPPPAAAPPVLVSETPATIASSSDHAGGVHVETIKIEPLKSPVSAPRPEPATNVAARSAPKPPAVANYSRAKLPRSRNPLALPSAVAMLLAVVYGGYWLKAHGYLSREGESDVAVAAKEPERPTRATARQPEGNAGARERSPQQAPTHVKTRVSPPRPAARQAAAVTTKPRPGTMSAPPPIPSASVAVPAVTTLPVALPVAASTASTAAAPQGPFFEPTDVHEAPRVSSRVAPDVPEELRGRARNEIVIVRMLISQSGRPSRVSLLRRSKTGPGVDEAVIAAVNQWTFSPARRKGEAVSSWFNIGVPLGE